MFKNRIFRKMAVVFLSMLCVLAFVGCDDESVGNEIERKSEVLEIFETLEDNDVMPFTITEKARETLNNKAEIFKKNSIDGLETLVDSTLEYKMLTKNIDKHGDTLLYLPEAYVLSIEETDMEDGTFTEMHLLDENENSYYVLSLLAYDDVYEGDVVSFYGLPLGQTSFENISGGTTLAVVAAGCYVEKLPY